MTTSRFAVPIADLERAAQVSTSEQVTEQAAPRLPEPLVAGPQLHPYGDGATNADADGD